MKKSIIILCIFAVLGIGLYWNSLDNIFLHDDDEVIVHNQGIKKLENIPLIFIDPGLSTSNPIFAGHYRPFVTVSYTIDYAIGGLNPVGYHLVNLAFHVGTAFLIFLIVKAMLGRSSEVRSQKEEARREQTEARSKKQEARNEQTEARSQKQEAGNQMSEVRSQKSEVRSKTSEVRSKKQDAGEQIPPDPSFLKVGWGGGVFFAALASGLIFLVHPFNSEAVNYATARSSVMSGFFYLLAFLCWVKYRSKKQEVRSQTEEARREEAEARSQKQEVRNEQEEARSKKQEARKNLDSYLFPLTSYFYIGSLFAFVAGMLSKEIVITLPIMLWLYDLYFTPTLTLPRRGGGERVVGLLNWRSYITYIPFVAVIAAYMGIRHVLFAGMIPHFQRDLWTQFLTELPVLAGHWVLFLWPKNLTLIHHIEIYRSITWPVVLSFVFLILYIITAVYLWLKGRLRGRLISFIMLWFFVVLLPTSIVPLNRIFQENRGYLAIISFVVVAGVVLGEISRRLSHNNRVYKPALVFLVILLIVYSVVTVKRNIVWGDSLLFWQDAAAKSPQSGTAYAGLSAAYRMQGDFLLSVEAARKGLQAEPKNLFLFFNLARSYYRMGEMDKAVHYYNKALLLGLNQRFLWEEVAFVLIKKGDLELAERYLKEALKIWADSPKLHLYMGLTLRGQGKIEESIKSFRKAIVLNPEYILAAYRLAETLEVMGQSAESVKWYGEVVRLASINIDLSDLPYGQDREVLEKLIEEAREKVHAKIQSSKQ